MGSRVGAGLHHRPPAPATVTVRYRTFHVSTWQDRLDSASSEIELLDVARDFVATFSPYDLCRLPDACVPEKLVD